MLSPEEQALLQNIKSLVQQIESIEESESDSDATTGDLQPIEKQEASPMKKKVTKQYEKEMTVKEKDTGNGPDIDAEYADDEAEYSEEEVEKALKVLSSLVRKSDEGATASDDAETRVEEDIPEETMDNVEEVAKAILALGRRRPARKRNVAKSASTSKIEKALLELTKVVKSLAVDHNESTKAVEAILEGIGIADAVKKSGREVRKSARVRRPARGNNDRVNKELISEIRGLKNVIQNGSGTETRGRGQVRKSLSENLGALLGNGPSGVPSVPNKNGRF